VKTPLIDGKVFPMKVRYFLTGKQSQVNNATPKKNHQKRSKKKKKKKKNETREGGKKEDLKKRTW